MNQNKNHRVIIWTTDIPKLLDGKPIGGITVQLYFWAQAFAKNGWQVYSFADGAKNTFTREGIVFIPNKYIKRINFLIEWWRSLRYMLTIHPLVIIYRGANRHLLPLALFSKLFRSKLVYFAASDVNFEPGKELVGSGYNRKLYHCSIRHIRFFVTQNKHQHETLLKNYGKESLTMYNIWGAVNFGRHNKLPESDAVWIANFRILKRAEWVINLAKKFPDLHFVMAGGRGCDIGYYEEMEQQAAGLANLEFLGGVGFSYANELVNCSRVLLCTSTFEGFPNTFLQAWSVGIPVISTVDPSGTISANGLGVVVQSEEDLAAALEKVLGDEDYYQELCQSVKNYFEKNHASQAGFNKVIAYINDKQ